MRPLVTVLRAQGLRVGIWVNDHRPAHVQVFGDGAARINLSRPDGAPELIGADNMSRGGVRRAMRFVTEQQTLLLARRREIRERPD